MALPSPILDDRSYQQLRDELVRRIPIYAPEWTDHNPSDPGITLVELFAFLGENLLFRFNQIPDSTKLEFLRLLQIPLRPATPARALLAFTSDAPAGALVAQGSELKAGDLAFETLIECRAWPLELAAFAKAQSAPPSDPEAVAFAARAIDARGGLADGEEPVYYEARATPSDPAAPDALAVDFGAAVDAMLWIAVLSTDATSTASLLGAAINVGFAPDEDVLGMAEVAPCPGEGFVAPAPSVVWQVSTGVLDGAGRPTYRTLELLADTTRGLSQQGVVRLALPREHGAAANFALADIDLHGTGDLPPAIDDEELAARTLFWIRAFRADGSTLGRVLWVGANASEAVQARKAQTEFLGVGTGQPHQSHRLIHRPVIERSLVVEVEGEDGWTRYAEVDGFHASAEDDRHFTVDREAGEVRFGSGLQGFAPQIGQRIRATEYRYGGGAQGNVPAKAIDKVAVAGARVGNPLPARGGAAAEEIARALERIPAEFRRRDRAVTASDFKELALATPGAVVGRAECLPLFHPREPGVRAAGVVSVVILPSSDKKRPDAPMPDRSLLRAVCAWLDARRLVTTELHVIPPTYRPIALSVGLQAKPGYGSEAVRRWVELVLRQYLAPLPPYGPSGEGWPLGRRVHGPELEAAALQVEGVEFLEGLEVAGWDEAAQRWRPGTVLLEPYELPQVTELTVVEGAPLAAGEPLAPPVAPRVPVPIPTLKEEC